MSRIVIKSIAERRGQLDSVVFSELGQFRGGALPHAIEAAGGHVANQGVACLGGTFGGFAGELVECTERLLTTPGFKELLREFLQIN